MTLPIAHHIQPKGEIVSRRRRRTRDVLDGAGPLRSPLKWAGGKRWQIPRLAKLWKPHSHRRLVEPFCGGLSVALGLSPTRALLNDINPHLINFYSHLKQGRLGRIRMANDERLYYGHRDRFNQLLSQGKEHTDEAAALFYYLNRTGFNGLCRFNQRGKFNVPFGSHKQITYARDFSGLKARFARWDLRNEHFEKLTLKRDDFVYADPPYDVEFTNYSKEGFNWDDQVRTARWLASHPGPVVLSNQATTRIVKLYRALGFRLRFVIAPRSISCNGDRTPAREVIATKNL